MKPSGLFGGRFQNGVPADTIVPPCPPGAASGLPARHHISATRDACRIFSLVGDAPRRTCPSPRDAHHRRRTRRASTRPLHRRTLVAECGVVAAPEPASIATAGARAEARLPRLV